MKRFVLSCGLLLVFTVICSCSKPAADTGFDWPQWRGPDGNGQSRETEWDPASIANPKILWAANIGLGYSNIVIQDGRLYATGMTRDGFTVSCLDAVTGKVRWKQPLETTSYLNPQATPAIDGRDLFILMTDGSLLALDARSGRQKWRKDLVEDYGAVKPFYGFAGSPVVADDLVLLTANTAGMAVNRETGDLAWTSDKPPQDFPSADRSHSTGTAYTTPVLYDDDHRAIFVSWRGMTSADIATGAANWRFDWIIEPGGGLPDPVVADDLVCMSWAYDPPLNPAGFLLRLTEGGTRLVWKTPDLVTIGPAPVILDGYIYTLHFGLTQNTAMPIASLQCLDLDTGEVVWEELGKRREGKMLALAAANETLIILDDLGTLSTAAASPGRLRRNRPVRCSGRRLTVPPVLDPAGALQREDLLPKLRRRPGVHRCEKA